MRAQIAPATELMLDLAHLRPGDRVLDIAAGDGFQSVAAALRVGSSGHVIAVDLAPEQVKRAAATAREAGIDHIETMVMDAESLDLPDGSFDAVLCQLGVMFLPDVDRGLLEILRVLKPGGHASLVISTPGGSPESDLVASMVRGRVGAATPMPTRGSGASLGARGVMRQKMEAAGFQAVEAQEVAVPLRLPSAEDAVNLVRDLHPTLDEMVAPLMAHEREALWREVNQATAAFVGPDGFESPSRVVVVAGARSTEATSG
jgi:SAM-dependent methyltransferase